MRTILLISAVLLAPVAAGVARWASERTAPCTLVVLRDYDFYFYYYAELRLSSRCNDRLTALQVRKVSNTMVGHPPHPLNVWPKGSSWYVTRNGDTVPRAFQVTSKKEHWEYRVNPRSPWRTAVVR